MAKKKAYAVLIGRKTGVFDSWEEAQRSVSGFPNATFKGFTTKKGAQDYYERNKDKVEPKQSKVSKEPKPTIPIGELTDEQNKVIEVLRSDKNVFLTGGAGTGKSFVLNYYIATNDKSALICAPTGIAAINIGGETIHKAFKIKPQPIGPQNEIEISKTVDAADVIIVDEISMCRFDLFEYMAKVILASEEKTGRKKQIIVVGDFFQLPPVISNDDRSVLEELWEGDIGKGFAFLAPSWKALDFETVELKEIVRQKSIEFTGALNDIRIGNNNAIEWINAHAVREVQNGITIVPTNKQVEEINNEEINKICTESIIIDAIIEGEFEPEKNPTSTHLELKENLRVMALCNDRQGRYQNGSLGTVVKADKDAVSVKFDTYPNVVVMEKNEWQNCSYKINEEGILEKEVVGTFSQIPLKAAYAVTVHKSQGQTYDAVNIDPYTFDVGQLYVVLSRVRDIEHMHLLEEIKDEYAKVSEEVQEFYSNTL